MFFFMNYKTWNPLSMELLATPQNFKFQFNLTNLFREICQNLLILPKFNLSLNKLKKLHLIKVIHSPQPHHISALLSKFKDKERGKWWSINWRMCMKWRGCVTLIMKHTFTWWKIKASLKLSCFCCQTNTSYFTTELPSFVFQI